MLIMNDYDNLRATAQEENCQFSNHEIYVLEDTPKPSKDVRSRDYPDDEPFRFLWDKEIDDDYEDLGENLRKILVEQEIENVLTDVVIAKVRDDRPRVNWMPRFAETIEHLRDMGFDYSSEFISWSNTNRDLLTVIYHYYSKWGISNEKIKRVYSYIVKQLKEHARQELAITNRTINVSVRFKKESECKNRVVQAQLKKYLLTRKLPCKVVVSDSPVEGTAIIDVRYDF